MIGRSKRCVLYAATPSETRRVLKEELEQRGVSVRVLTTEEDCLRSLREQECDFLVVDIDGDPAVGLQALRVSRNVTPDLPQLVLVPHDDITSTVRAMKAGATNCLEKPIDPNRLRSVLAAVLNQRNSVSPQQGTVLTRMETLVLRHILEGKTGREIAAVLNRSPRTVEVHRRNIMRKLGVSNVVELVKEVGTTRLPETEGKAPGRRSGKGKYITENRRGRKLEP